VFTAQGRCGGACAPAFQPPLISPTGSTPRWAITAGRAQSTTGLCPLAHRCRTVNFVQVNHHQERPLRPRLLNSWAHRRPRQPQFVQWYKRQPSATKNTCGARTCSSGNWAATALNALLNGEAIAKGGAAAQSRRHAKTCSLNRLRRRYPAKSWCSTACARTIRLASEAAAPVLSNEDLARSVGQAGRNTGHPDTSGSGDPLALKGLDYRLGGCCCPLPGEAIRGSVASHHRHQPFHCAKMAPTSTRSPVEAPPAPCTGTPSTDPSAAVTPWQLRNRKCFDRVGVPQGHPSPRLSDSRNQRPATPRPPPPTAKPASSTSRWKLLSPANWRTTIDQIRSMAACSTSAATGHRLEGRAAFHASDASTAPASPCPFDLHRGLGGDYWEMWWRRGLSTDAPCASATRAAAPLGNRSRRR